MKTTNLFPPIQKSQWQLVAEELEQKFMTRTKGKNRFMRKIRCNTKFMIIRLLEMTY